MLIYGAAGTGKTTLIKYISNMFGDAKKLYITKTHTALQNVIRNLGKNFDNCDFEIIDSITVFSEVANCKFNMSCKIEDTAIQYDELMESCSCETVKSEKFCWKNLEYNVLAA